MKSLKNLFKFDVLDSTQDKAFELLKIFDEVIVIANRMEKGRGRYGNSWISEPGGLYMSIGFKNKTVDFSKKLLIITPICILYVLTFYQINAKIKIPNDIYYENKKICGILIEMKENEVVLGIGLNVNQSNFPQNLLATSMFLIKKKFFSIDEIALKIYENLKVLINYNFDFIISQYNSFISKEFVEFEYKGKIHKGRILEVNKNFELILDIGSFDLFYVRNLRSIT